MKRRSVKLIWGLVATMFLLAIVAGLYTDSKTSVKAAEIVCSVDDIDFESLSDAIQYINDNSSTNTDVTLKILSDISDNNNYTINCPKVTLDLNGHQLIFGNRQYVMTSVL